LSEVVDLIAREAYPTLLELDLKDRIAWPSPRVEELARLLEPVKDRVTFGGGAYWNLRSLHQVDPDLRLGFTPSDSFDWSSTTDPGAQLLSLVPGVKDIHVRVNSAIRVCQDGVVDLAEVLHSRGMLLDVWTLNAGQPHWRERLRGALELGADVITTATPRALSEAAAEV
jgi:glycerophosphoryl diester phosphodiesterase